MMLRVRLLSLFALLGLLSAAIWAADLPGDEATNRKLLALWKSEPDRMNRLHEHLSAYRALTNEQQDRLLKLDRDLHQLDSSAQARLRSVMERYAGWLNRLPREDRERLSKTAPGPQRIRLIEELLDRQWQEALPKPDQDRLAKAAPAEKAQMLDQLRKDDEERRKVRLQARRIVEEAAVLGPLPFGQPEFRDRVQLYVEESLRPLLSPLEEIRLNASAKGTWQRYFQAVFELSDGRTPMPLPAPAPPGRKKAVRSWRDLPTAVTEKFPPPVPERITAAEGKWPQLPMAVAAEARERGVAIPFNALGPTRLDELPAGLQRFVRDDLIPKLNDAERKQLGEAESRWPDYPRKIKELSDKKSLTIPGLALPGSREAWQNLLRAVRPGKLGQ